MAVTQRQPVHRSNAAQAGRDRAQGIRADRHGPTPGPSRRPRSGSGSAVVHRLRALLGVLLGPGLRRWLRGRRLPVAVLLAADRGRASCRPGCRRRSSSCGSRSASGPPATTSGAPTTGPTSSIRRPARSGNRGPIGATRWRRAFPFILQNLHRIFLYLQFIPLAFLWLDAFLALHPDGTWRLGLGNVILFADLVLLTGYSLSCHSLRHFVGGRLDCFSCTARNRARRSLWQRLSEPQRQPHPRWPPGEPARGRRWPTCTSGCWPSGCSTTRRSGCEPRSASGIPTTSW